MVRIFFVLFISFTSTAFAQNASQPLPPLTLDKCLALPCNSQEQWMDGPAELLAQLYTQATEQRNRCSSVLRKEAMRTEAAVKKIACLKARQRSLACAVSVVHEDQVVLFTRKGISPALVAVQLLIDLSSRSMAPPCTTESKIRSRYSSLLSAQFNDCFDKSVGNTQSCYYLCEQLSRNVRDVIPDEWGISRDEVSSFEWPSDGFKREPLDSEEPIKGRPSLMCSATRMAYSP